MKPAPGTTFEVVEADLALEVLVVALDAPPQLGDPHQLLEGEVCGQRGEVEARLIVARLPLAEQPLLVSGWPSLRMLFCGADSVREKLRRELAARAFSPRNGLVSMTRDAAHQLGDLDRLLVAITPSSIRGPHLVGIFPRRFRVGPWRPDQMVVRDTDD